MWIITADDGLKVRILLFFDLIGWCLTNQIKK
jgi:hypothetical protein